MLQVCKKLREVDAKSKRLGLVSTETDYLRALLDAMADMDRCVEVEVLKSLGDVSLEKGRLDKNPEKFDSAMVLYRTALIRCEDLDLGESLGYRYHYAEKLKLGKRSMDSSSYKPLTKEKKMYSLAKLSEKFLQLDRRLKGRGNRGSVLLEYTKIVIEGIVNCDTMLETEAIKSLGDVYLKRGTETEDSTNLTKATALYNTALSRCEEFQGKETLIHRLLYTARIRQESTRIQENQKHRAQQRGHVQRGFPMTSPDTDVIGDTKSQQSTSRSYEEYLTTGDRALADGKLDVAEQDFASALRLIHDPNRPNRCKEAECLCRLADVYVQRGKTTKEGRKFTQAAALYNAAMARTGENGHDVRKSLQDTEHCFLQYTANVDTSCRPIAADSALRHRIYLEEMRKRAKSQLDAIDQQHNPYKYDEDDPVMMTVEAERAEAIKALSKGIAQDRQNVIEDLVDECIATLGPPPCKYAFIGLGSQATELVTPYSDLEFAILIEDGKDNDDTRQYFINLTHYLHLKVINLGETILPAMAIPSLNDFQSDDPGKDWFFDSVTPRGFAFDGFMPWASKTPFGRDQTKTKPPVSLIQTPVEMFKYQQLEISLAEGYHLSDILRRCVLLTGEETLVDEYMRKLNEIMTDDLRSPIQSRQSAMLILMEKKKQFSTNEPTGQLLNVKKDIYRFPDMALGVIALCCQIILASSWDLIDKLKETEQIQEENATHIMILTSISAELRLRTYLANGGQKDSMSPLVEYPKTHEVSDTTLTSIFHIPDTEVLFRYHCRAMPLKKYMLDMVKNSLEGQPKKKIKMTIFDASNKCRGQIARKMYLSDRAKGYLEAALTDTGRDVIERSEILDELGNLLFFDGNVTQALRLFEESLTMRKRLYGHDAENLLIASSLGNLGSCYNKLSNQKVAISYYEESLRMQKMIYGDNEAQPDIAKSLHDLATSWTKLSDWNKAISYFEQSLTMSKTMYGDNTAHPTIATILHNLGVCMSELRVQKKALRYYEQALSMMKTICGNNTAHPDIAILLTSIGSSWCKLGDANKAIRYFEQSLMMNKTIYGDNRAHPHIAASLQNLGSAWCELGDQEKAISYYEQSLSMNRSMYSDNMARPDIAASLSNLGSVWGKLGDHKKAISYFKQSLTIMKIVYGDNTAHPDIAMSLYHLGLSWVKLGDHKRSVIYNEEFLTMIKIVFGDNTAHPDIAESLNNLGCSWGELGDHRKAISFYKQSLTIMKTIYGDNTAHMHIASTRENLGLCWFKLGDLKKAITYLEQSLTMRKTLFGKNTAHPDIVRTLDMLVLACRNNGDQRRALEYIHQIESIQRDLNA